METSMKEINFTDIDGILVGNAEDQQAATGCTVLISENGVTVGVDIRGGAPGTRETDLLNPVNLIEKVHAVFLAGGSAFGLDAGAGVMQFLEERKIGFDVQVTTVPIVCGAVLFDLTIGDHTVRPDKEMGYQACRNASNSPFRQGSIGAGTGATVGKICGMDRAMKSGLGCYALQVGNVKIGALVAVNCLGDVVDPLTGRIVAGALSENRTKFVETEKVMIETHAEKKNIFVSNTTIGVVTTNALLTKSQATKLASMAQNGYARTLRPAHTMFDGDTIFAMATGEIEADINVLGLLAARTMERAVVSAVMHATSLCGLPSSSDLHGPG